MLKPLQILVLLLVGVSTSMLAQTHNIVFEDFTANGVMEGKSIIKIVQDHEGFMWFGALDGLYRYDGNRIKVFQYDEEDSTSISDNYIRALFVDSKGTLWVGSWNNGLNKYDPEQENFYRYQYNPDDPNSISANNIEDIQEDSKGRLWISTGSSGLNLFDYDNEHFKQFRAPEYFSNDSLWVVCEDQDQKLWVGHQNGVDCLNLNTLKKENLSSEFDQLKGFWVTAIHEDIKGDIWFGTWRNGLFRWKKDIKKLEEVFYANGEKAISTKDFFDGQDDLLWIINKDISFMDLEKNRLVKYNSPANAAFKIENRENWPICQDNEGTIWIGSWGGLAKHKPSLNIFDYSYKKFFQDASFYNDTIQSIKEDDQGNLWIIWNEAIGYWDLSKESIQYFDLRGKLSYRGENWIITNLFQDSQGLIWLSTHFGPFVYDIKKNAITHLNELLETPKKGLSIHTPEFVEDKNGNIWIGTMEGGMFCYDYQNNTIQNFHPITDDSSSLGYNLIEDIYLDKDEILWVGTYGAGVDRFDPKTRKVSHHFKNEPANPNSLSQDRVLDIIEDNFGNLWIGTEDGLNVLDKKTFKVTNLSEKLNLGKGFFDRLKINKSGQVLANHLGELIVIDPQDYSYKTIGKSEGLLGLKESSVSIPEYALVSKLDRVFFVESKNNILSFHLDSIKKNTLIPSVKIIGLKYRRMEDAQEKQFEFEGLPQKKSVRLSYKDDLITIDFASLSFFKAAQNQFKYRLLPSNPNWINLNQQSSVNFMNLPSGNYTFEVMGSNGDGIWNPEPTSLNIYIAPPWWASPLARLVYALFFLTGIFIFIRLRLRGLIQRQKILEERVEQRTHELAEAKQEAEAANEAKSIFLSTVSHELRTPLTSIIGFTKLNKKSLEERISPAISENNEKAQKAIKKLNQNLDIVSAEGERLTTLINDLLDLAKIEAGKIDWKIEKVNPNEVLEHALSSTAVLFEQKKLRLSKHIPKKLGFIKADKDRIIQVVINLISNAVKFTEKGWVKVSAVQENENLLVRVQDSGKGIAFSDLPKVFEKFKQVGDNMTDKPDGTGLGLPICKEIIDFHKGEIWVESEEGKGSTFSFLLPMEKES